MTRCRGAGRRASMRTETRHVAGLQRGESACASHARQKVACSTRQEKPLRAAKTNRQHNNTHLGHVRIVEAVPLMLGSVLRHRSVVPASHAATVLRHRKKVIQQSVSGHRAIHSRRQVARARCSATHGHGTEVQASQGKVHLSQQKSETQSTQPPPSLSAVAPACQCGRESCFLGDS